MKTFKLFAALFLLLALSACKTTSEPSRADRREQMRDQDLAAHENLYIRRPRLSPDGRTLVFDFIDVESRRGNDLYHSGSKLALYDLKTQNIRIIGPRPPLQWHSASFDSTGQKLTMVVACWVSDCPDELKGTQIGVVDLDDSNIKMATDGSRPVTFWKYTYGDYDDSKLRTYKANGHTIRGYPIFSKNDQIIYYVISRPGIRSLELGPRSNPDATLMVTDVPLSEGISDLEEEVLLHPDLGPTIFIGGGGPLSLSGERLLFRTSQVSHGQNRKDFNKQQATAYYLDFKSGRVFPALTVTDQAVGLTKEEFTNRIYTPMSSADGSRIVLIRGKPHKYLSLIEDGIIRNLLSAGEIGIAGFENSAISANGRWVVALPEIEAGFKNKDSLWLIDLSTNKRTELPLRSLLRKELNNKEF